MGRASNVHAGCDQRNALVLGCRSALRAHDWLRGVDLCLGEREVVECRPFPVLLPGDAGDLCQEPVDLQDRTSELARTTIHARSSARTVRSVPYAAPGMPGDCSDFGLFWRPHPVAGKNIDTTGDRSMIENLEPRKLFAGVSLQKGVLTVNGTEDSDLVQFQRERKTDVNPTGDVFFRDHLIVILNSEVIADFA